MKKIKRKKGLNEKGRKEKRTDTITNKKSTKY